MIVRISGEGQYRLEPADEAELNELDNAVVAAVDQGDEELFQTAFEELLRYIRDKGAALTDTELEASDVIVPPTDLTFDEAGADFTGDGLIPD